MTRSDSVHSSNVFWWTTNIFLLLFRSTRESSFKSFVLLLPRKYLHFAQRSIEAPPSKRSASRIARAIQLWVNLDDPADRQTEWPQTSKSWNHPPSRWNVVRSNYLSYRWWSLIDCNALSHASRALVQHAACSCSLTPWWWLLKGLRLAEGGGRGHLRLGTRLNNTKTTVQPVPPPFRCGYTVTVA